MHIVPFSQTSFTCPVQSVCRSSYPAQGRALLRGHLQRCQIRSQEATCIKSPPTLLSRSQRLFSSAPTRQSLVCTGTAAAIRSRAPGGQPRPTPRVGVKEPPGPSTCRRAAKYPRMTALRRQGQFCLSSTLTCVLNVVFNTTFVECAPLSGKLSAAYHLLESRLRLNFANKVGIYNWRPNVSIGIDENPERGDIRLVDSEEHP